MGQSWLAAINVWSLLMMLAADLFDFIDLERDFTQNQSFSQSVGQSWKANVCV